MDLRFSPEEDAFRAEVREWLEKRLAGPFAELRGRGGPGDDEGLFEERRAWERELAAGGWTCIEWPKIYGGRGASLIQSVIFHEEYARAGGPGRLGHIGETLLGPTVLAFGTEEQKRRFLPPILRAEALWCQGYSEPGAGSDLAAVQCRAIRDGDGWIVTGRKSWVSMAEWADWCFVLCRTDTDAPRHRGISCLLVPMRQPGVTIRPIRQITGGSEFAEVSFEGARATDVIGPPNGGWKVAMATLGFERGASTLAQQLGFASELAEVLEAARANGAIADPVMRQRLAHAWIGLRIMRLNALRMLSEPSGSRVAAINKIYWSTWHRDLGELAVDVLGAASEVMLGEPYRISRLQRLFLWSRSETIYAGSNQIQRDILGERVLGLPRDTR